MTRNPAAFRLSPAQAIGLFLLLPMPLIYVFLGSPWLAAATGAVAIITIHQFRDVDSAPNNLAITIACAITALALTIVGGGWRLLPVVSDWLTRDAVLHDMVVQPWPFAYRFDGNDWMLRAPLGMYLLPALCGKLFGLAAAYTALAIQNALALYAVLRVLCASADRRRSIVVLGVFVLFSGWDIIGAQLIAQHRTVPDALQGLIVHHVEWWTSIFQYSSALTQVIWVPNHALAGWFIAALVLLWDQRRLPIGALATGAALSALWSPFALIGALPFLAWAGGEALIERRIAARDLLLPAWLALCLIPLAAFLVADSAAVPHGFLPLTGQVLTTYPLFIGLEVLPFVVLNHAYGKNDLGVGRAYYRIAVGFLILLPVYSLGAANDLAMRASISALAILAVATGHTAWHVLASRRALAIVLTATTLAIGAVTGLNQLWEVMHDGSRGIRTCDLVQTWDQQPRPDTPKAQYLARTDHLPGFARSVPRSVHPTGRADFACADRLL